MAKTTGEVCLLTIKMISSDGCADDKGELHGLYIQRYSCLHIRIQAREPRSILRQVSISAHTGVIQTEGVVSIDGAEPVVQLGRAAAPGVYQQHLFSAGDLDTAKEHEVRITNLPSQTPDRGESQQRRSPRAC